MLDLSIIIPVYNTPVPVLTRCLTSVEAITGVSFEVVLVDDGSGPSTADFCTQYAAEHPVVRCLHKENGGVSSARNMGLCNARGRYVLFADADDEVLSEAFCQPLEGDLILFDAYVQDGDRQQLVRTLSAPEPDRQLLLQKLLTTKALNTPWAKLYRADLLQQHQIRFLEEFVTGEDWMFVCDFVQVCKTVAYVSTPCYRYYLDSNNTRTRAARHPDKIIDNQLARFARKQQIADSEPWHGCTGPQLMSAAATELIENLFNTASDLLLEKVFTKQRKQRLYGAAKAAGKLLLPPVSKKTRLKLTVLSSARFALWPLAQMRALYLKKH